ncbi:MAG: hypothetical protein SFX18_19230 [Pirellulales bacterium]|nr:hypothetical protein [Pirellulales bacterium]
MRCYRLWTLCLLSATSLVFGPQLLLNAQVIVPGTGTKIAVAGDDFEDESWAYIPNNPKSSDEDDENSRFPAGYSANRRWFEGVKRGHPDLVKRIDTPAGGLAGSKGALLLQTLRSGIPNQFLNKPMQDDFVANVISNTGGMLHVSRSPNVVCRVYLPPFEQWERRSGNTFGFRLACRGNPTRATNSEFKNSDGTETYWPGFFIWHTMPSPQRKMEESAHFILRAGPVGQDFRGPEITREQLGWWTLGLSCSPDGAVHYYAKQGIENLTPEDWIATERPYGYRCTHMETFFFNVLNQDNGRTWSTPWVIDDPSVYYTGPQINPPTVKQQTVRQQPARQQTVRQPSRSTPGASQKSAAKKKSTAGR